MYRTVLLIATLLVVAPVAGVAGASAPAPATATTADATAGSSYQNVIDSSNESIGIWERAAFPLRADTTAAETTVQNQQLMVEHWDPNEGSVSARYGTLGVFGADQSIPVDFEDTDLHPIQQFDDDNATVVVGKFDDNSSGVDDIPTSLDSVADLLPDTDLSTLNDNATFRNVSTEEITSEGFSTSFTPSDAFDDGAGQYVVMAAVANGSTDAPDIVDSGDLAPSEEIVVVGMDQVIAQDAASSVDVGDAEPGDTVTFDANANVGTDGNVTHAVALYDKETFTNAETTFNLTDEIDGNFSADNVSIESTISELNGVVATEDGVPTASLASVGSVFTASADGFDATDVETASTVLDASTLTRTNASVDASLDVETFGNWSEGTYQWVHIASTDGELATNAGEITIEEDGGGGGGIPLPPPSPGEPDISLVDTSLSSTDVGAGESFEISATFENAGDASGMKIVELRRDGKLVDEVTVDLDAGAEETVTFTQALDDAGAYTYSIDGTTIGTVGVTIPPAAFETSDAEASAFTVSTGESVDVTATVTNTGGTFGPHTAELQIDGETVDTTEVKLEPGASATVEFTHTFEDAGEYEVSVDDERAARVTVQGDGDGDGLPGFGPVAALLGLAATLLIARTRSS